MKKTLDKLVNAKRNTVSGERVEKSTFTGKIINAYQQRGITHKTSRTIINLFDEEAGESTPVRRVINLFKEKVEESILRRRIMGCLLEE